MLTLLMTKIEKMIIANDDDDDDGDNTYYPELG
jgi:hypothetical protein